MNVKNILIWIVLLVAMFWGGSYWRNLQLRPSVALTAADSKAAPAAAATETKPATATATAESKPAAAAAPADAKPATVAAPAAGGQAGGNAPAGAAGAGGPPKAPPPLPVEVVSVKPGVVIRAIQAVGTLRANESVIVRPELGGRIQEVHFKEGQAVEKGAPLVTMETSINAAELEQAKARLGLSQVNDQRMGSLRKKGLGSEQEEDQMRSDLRVNQASVALAEARLAKMTVRAPFNGVLGLRLVSVGDYLSPGQDMVNLLNLDPIKVDFRIPELLLSQIKVGQAIEVKVDAFPDQKFSGAVYAIDPQVDVNGRSLLLRATIPNKEQRLYAGLFARVDLILERRDGALLVPEEALVPQGDKQYVFKVVEDKAVRTEVKLGQRQGAQVEIADGLKAGDQVVTAGQIKIRDGAPVKPISLDKG